MGLPPVTCHDVDVAVTVDITESQREGAVAVGTDRDARHAVERDRGTVVEEDAVGRVVVPGHGIEVTVTVHVGEGDGLRQQVIVAKVSTTAIERIRPTRVEVVPVRRVPGVGRRDEVQVAVAVEVPQHDGCGDVAFRVATDTDPRHAGERVGATVVEEQQVRPAGQSDDEVRVPVAVDIAEGSGTCAGGPQDVIGGDIAAVVGKRVGLAVVQVEPGDAGAVDRDIVDIAVAVHVAPGQARGPILVREGRSPARVGRRHPAGDRRPVALYEGEVQRLLGRVPVGSGTIGVQ